MPSSSRKKKSSKKNKARRVHAKAHATPFSPGNGKLKSIVEKNSESGCRSPNEGSDGGEFFTPISQFHQNPSFCKAELGEEEGEETVKSSELSSKREDEGLLEVVEEALEREESWESHEVNFEYIGFARNSPGGGSLGDDEGTSFSNSDNEIRKEGNHVSITETTSLEGSVKPDDAYVKKELNAVIEVAPTGCNPVAEERKNVHIHNSFDPVHSFHKWVGCGTATAMEELVFSGEVDLGLNEEKKGAPIVNTLEEAQSPKEVDCGTAAAPIEKFVVSGVESLGLKENDQLLASLEEVPGVSTTSIDLPVKKKEGKEGKVFPLPNGHGCASSKGMDFEPKVNGDVFPALVDYGCASSKGMDFKSNANGDVFPVPIEYGCVSSKGMDFEPKVNGDVFPVPIEYGCVSSKVMDFEPKVNGDVIPVADEHGCVSSKGMDFEPKVNGDVIPVADELGCVSSKEINIEPAINGDKSSLPSDSLMSEEILNCSENQPLIASPQLAKTTSWKSCCGLFDVLTSSN